MGKPIVVIVLGVVALLSLTLESSAQKRIRFAKGRTSATVSGTLAGGGKQTYVLGAKQGQYLSGNVSSGNGCVKFTEGATSIGFTTQNGDNLLSVTNYCAKPTAFTMTVSINYGSD